MSYFFPVVCIEGKFESLEFLQFSDSKSHHFCSFRDVSCNSWKNIVNNITNIFQFMMSQEEILLSSWITG